MQKNSKRERPTRFFFLYFTSSGSMDEGKARTQNEEEEEGRELLLKVANFFHRKRAENAIYGGDANGGLETILEDWVSSHLEDLSDISEADISDGSGHSHAMRSLWQGYCEEFEKSCDWAIEVEGGDPKIFFAACEEVCKGGGLFTLQREEPDSALSWFLVCPDFLV